MESKYGKAKRVWVLDRGIVSEDNLEFLRNRNAQYIVGTLRSSLRHFKDEITKKDWHEVQDGVEVKIVRHPDYGNEKFVLCRSEGRVQKEKAILERQINCLNENLQKIRMSVLKGRLKSEWQIGQRIGRWLGRYSKAASLFETELVRDSQGNIIDLTIEYRIDKIDWAEKTNGCYLLRTNLTNEDPKDLWKTYMQLAQAEKAFRISKSDLGLRPVFHQKERRVQAHIFICFLALAMYKCLEMWMEQKGLGRSPAKLLEEFREIRSMDVVLPIKNRNSVRLRLVGKPDEHARVLLHRLGLRLPNRPKMMTNVVKTLPLHLL